MLGFMLPSRGNKPDGSENMKKTTVPSIPFGNPVVKGTVLCLEDGLPLFPCIASKKMH